MSIAAAAKRHSKTKKTAVTKDERRGKRTFPVDKVQKLWAEGKTMAQIAKATGRYDDKAKDPTASFRGSVNVLRKKGILNIGFRSKRNAA